MIRTVQHGVLTLAMSIVVLGVLVGASSIPVAAQPTDLPSTLVAIRAAYHPEATPAYDRVVFEFTGRLPEHLRIEYVSRLIADGSGAVLPVEGKGIVQLVLSPALAHTDAGKSTVPGRIQYNLPFVKEIVCSGDFEAVVSYGIGVSRKTEIRFFTLTSPTRVVIDFLHT